MNTISQDVLSALQSTGLVPAATIGTNKWADFAALVSALTDAMESTPAATPATAAAPASGATATQIATPQTSGTTPSATPTPPGGVSQTTVNKVLTSRQPAHTGGLLGDVSLTVGDDSALAGALASRPANWYAQIWGTPDHPKDPDLFASNAASFYANIPTNARILAAGGTLNGWTADLGNSAAAVNGGQQTIAANGGRVAMSAVQLVPESAPTGATGEITDPTTGLAIQLPRGTQLSDYFGSGTGQSSLSALFPDNGSDAGSSQTDGQP